MDPERKRTEEDLRGLVSGEVRCDDTAVQLYATDASIYEIRPLGVVRPRSVDDVVAIARYASEQNIPLHARGAGSGLAGSALGRGLIVDFSHGMRRVLELGPASVRVQSGVVHGELNRLLATHGRRFGPDPDSSQVTTMGGVAAVNATGSHFLRYGTPRDHIQQQQVVLADGTLLVVGRHAVPTVEPPYAESPTPEERLDRLVWQIAELIERSRTLIADTSIRTPINSSGYQLSDVLADGQLDLARLLVGSEGTLALTTELEFATQSDPAHSGCTLLVFDSLDKAARAVGHVLSLKPSACDLMDRRHLSLARELDVRYEQLIPGAAEAVLLVEFDGETPGQVQQLLHEAVELVTNTHRLAAEAMVATDASDNALFWELAQRFVPTLHRLQGVRRAVPFVDDMTLPIAALPVFFRHMQDVLKQEQVTASVFGHAGQGQLHVRPLLDMSNPNEKRRMERIAGRLYEKLWLLGGTVSGSHGDGLSRTPFLAGQYGPLVGVFRELKRLFDPASILNPGKVVPEAGARMIHHLRKLVADVDRPADANGHPDESQPAKLGGAGQLVDIELDWTIDQMHHTARSCNGCALCRTRDPGTRMCPVNRYAPREEASPRAKANLLRSILTGELPPEAVLHEDSKQVADLCFHCHMCRLECPASVDIPRLMVEAKSQYVSNNGLNLHGWMHANIDSVVRLASRSPGLSNWFLRNRQTRWLIEKIVGVSQARSIPRLAKRSFLSRGGFDTLSSHDDDRPRIVLFLDTYANYFDPELAEATLAVLQQNGVEIYIPPNQQQCGMPLIAAGSLDVARRVAHRNVAALAEAVRLGYTIISTEPTAVLALTREYPTILGDDEDVRLVSENTQEACHYLWRLHQRGRLDLDFQQLNVDLAHHVPCHLKALEVGTPSSNLLKLIPGVKVRDVQKGCSGMAGTWGLRKENYRNSLRIGLPLISEVRDGPYHAAVTECSTCTLQIDHGSHKPTLHPVKIIAAAYGLIELPPKIV